MSHSFINQSEVFKDISWNILGISTKLVQIYYIAYAPQKLMVEWNHIQIQLLDLCQHKKGNLDIQKNVNIVH